MSKRKVIGNPNECILCKSEGYSEPLETHEIFFGNGKRQLSIEDGLCIKLCALRCHREGPLSVHKNRETDLKLKRMGQKYTIEHLGMSKETFIARYGRSYL